MSFYTVGHQQIDNTTCANEDITVHNRDLKHSPAASEALACYDNGAGAT